MAQTLHSLLHAVGLPVLEGCPNPAITALTCDSRCASNGGLFLGLPGERVDGGSFWRQTLADGAAAAVIGAAAAQADPPSPRDPVVVVSDPVADWAGALAAALLESSGMGLLELAGNDETCAAHALWQQWKDQPEALLRLASHGQRLQRLGDHDADLACCAAIDSLTVVPSQQEPGVLRLS